MITDENSLRKAISRVVPVSSQWIEKAYMRLDNLTKPRRSLGRLEEIAARYVAIREHAGPSMGKKRVVVFVGDHGVVAEGVSAYPQAVTGLMVANFLKGRAAINVLARRAGASVEVVDVGMASDAPRADGLIRAKVKPGASNIAVGPAMTIAEAVKAIGVGMDRASAAAGDGVTVLATGEMGIGNSTPAAALMAVYLGLSPADVAGPGTGLDAEGVKKKVEVISRALEVNRSACGTPLQVLASLGGLEIAAICGLCLGAAMKRMAVAVDGYISAAGALAAMRLCPAAGDYMFFSHMSAEPGHRRFFEAAGLRPIIDLGMRLGEGTGAVIGIQVIEDAVAVYNEMATFEEAGIVPGA